MKQHTGTGSSRARWRGSSPSPSECLYDIPGTYRTFPPEIGIVRTRRHLVWRIEGAMQGVDMERQRRRIQLPPGVLLLFYAVMRRSAMLTLVVCSKTDLQ